MIGKTISHYKILEKLGEGGMGVVYLAEDSKLKRIVAIKFLPRHVSSNKEDRKRFEIEAQAAAALNHSNIAHIYAIEETDDEIFIVMEYINGMELKEKIKTALLPIDEVINIVNQIADGLDAAHKKGIVHRDIKSSNIMITKDGKVKIMDFGLAKIKGGAELTKIGSTVGTTAYMSPEQTKGEEVDHQTDIWSFGVVLFEMLSGELPFKGDYEQAIIYSILNEDPKSIIELREDTPSQLTHIVQKTLHKNPTNRYQTTEDLIEELIALDKSGSSIKEKIYTPAIAVLPFSNMSNDTDQEYFCEGIAEEILNVVSKIEGLRVLSRTSSFMFREKNLDIRDIGEKLKVDFILEGSVRKSGDRIRISVQLINIKDGFHLWSERYDRKLEDIFAVQDDIALNVLTPLKGVLTLDEKEKIQRPETSIQAYEFYLQGRHNLFQLNFQKAKKYFKKAIEEDPAYAPAYAGLANTFSWIYEWVGRNKEDLEAAEIYSKKALELAENFSESHTARAYVLFLDENYQEAEREFLQAIKMDPKAYDAYYLFARMSFTRGEINRASELFLKASNINKEDFQSTALLAMTYQKLGNQEQSKYYVSETTVRTERQVELDPENHRALSLGAINYIHAGDLQKGLKWQEKVELLYPDESSVLTNSACFYALAGMPAKAIDHLEKLINQGFGSLGWLENDPDYDSLRDHPRFIELMQKLK